MGCSVAKFAMPISGCCRLLTSRLKLSLPHLLHLPASSLHLLFTYHNPSLSLPCLDLSFCPTLPLSLYILAPLASFPHPLPRPTPLNPSPPISLQRFFPAALPAPSLPQYTALRTPPPLSVSRLRLRYRSVSLRVIKALALKHNVTRAMNVSLGRVV